MEPTIPWRPAPEPGAPRSHDDAEFSDVLAAAVGGARRRAVRDGDRQIDTAHLLRSLLEYDFDVRAVFGEGPRAARLLGYLVQRSIGYGLRWQSRVEESGGSARTTTGASLNPGGFGAGAMGGTEGFSPVAAGAVAYARQRAAERGATRVRGLDLLAAIVVDPQARAVEVLARAGIDTVQVLARIDKYGEEAVERYGEESVEDARGVGECAL